MVQTSAVQTGKPPIAPRNAWLPWGRPGAQNTLPGVPATARIIRAGLLRGRRNKLIAAAVFSNG
jgi:hypothetical protein